MIEFANHRFSHGMPTLEAQRLGPAAVPILDGILQDPTSKLSWKVVLQAIAAVGLPGAYNTLHGFIWNRFNGLIDDTTYTAMIAAQVAMWMAAPTRPEVVQYLETCASPEFWDALPWHLPIGSQRSVSIAMSRVSINALSCIATPSAIRILERLSLAPPNPRELTNIREGLVREDRILRLGEEAAFQEELRSLQGFDVPPEFRDRSKLE